MPASQYLPIIRQASSRFGVPADLLGAQIQQESGFNPNARSPAGALGISQFMPATARGFGINPLNPNQSILAQAKYDANLYKQFGSWDLALAAYNAGAGAVSRYHGIPPFAETQRYVQAVQQGRSRFPGLAAGRQQYGGDAGTPPAPPTTSIPTMSVRQSGTRTFDAGPSNLGAAYLNRFANQAATQRGMKQTAPVATPHQQITVPLYKATKGSVSASDPQLGALPSAVRPTAQKAVQLARAYMGTPYKWGGADPKTGFDCSGLIQYVYKQAGVSLPRVAAAQYQVGQHVDLQHLQPGDAVFFRDQTGIHHEGLYIGHGSFLHAPHTGDHVKISSLSDSYYASQFAGGRRFG